MAVIIIPTIEQSRVVEDRSKAKDGTSNDPELIYRVQRAGILRRLVDEERVIELDAERWISRWEREADANGPGWRAFGLSRP